ncbi:MAG: ankyrin repeat domain-containing protein [Candidatus Dormibacteraeota bacterium]|uniref:Ankyrin repeat domain-containing protein n=1 Tax=Candidatus Amunia macphersoniae TaxID=3127014 RepID=A0A934KJW8_9BACT|nr:ankyrin repeat domain-containing protein [Candidatus Dormibacteraeota bacterium]
MLTLAHDDPVAVELVLAIRGGDVVTLTRLLGEHPGLASARIGGPKGRTPLHVVTDWPGYFPCGPQIVAVLIDAGADPSAPAEPDAPSETPLHWAASSDDSDVAAALIDGGADLEAPGASIAGGPPLDCAVGYGCWNVARLLVERGAKVGSLWHAAALGMIPLVKEFQAADPPPTTDDITAAFWQACHGGQRRMAEYLLSRGADINAFPDYTSATPLDIAGNIGTRRDTMTSWLREQGAISAENPPCTPPDKR